MKLLMFLEINRVLIYNFVNEYSTVVSVFTF